MGSIEILNLHSSAWKSGVLTIRPQSYMRNRAEVEFNHPPFSSQSHWFISALFSDIVLISKKICYPCYR